MKILNRHFAKAIIVILLICVGNQASGQTYGDAIIYPNSSIGSKIEYFFFDLKGWPNSISSTSIANDLFVTDDMNGIRISIYGDASHPAHPSAGQIVKTEYDQLLSSMARANAARGEKDFYVFASKKLDGQTSFPNWTKDANGVIVTEYVKLLTDYILFMKTKGYEIDYLAIQNEEQYNEGNITPAKHKAIVDSLRNISVRLNFKMPLIVGYEDYGPNKNNWMKTMKSSGYLDRMDIYGTHYYPNLRPLAGLKSDLAYAGNMPFWSTEPHWDDRATVDVWDAAEQAMCAFWDQIEVGMSGFMWWGYKRTGNLRGYLMQTTSALIKDAQMIDMDDMDGPGTNTYGKLQTRAFREGDKLTVYAINNNATATYSDYGFGLSVGTITGTVYYRQWLKTGAVSGINGSVIPQTNSKFNLTLPPQSITVFSLNINAPTLVNSVGANTRTLSLFPTLVYNELNISGLTQNSSYRIFDTSGKKVIESDLLSLNTSSLSKGLYLIRSTTGQVAKFFKK